MTMLRIINLGAGVQSTTMALMAAAGEIGPMPDCAIFADTQSEPKAVYRHLDWLEKQLPFPVHRVTVGSLREQIIAAMKGESRMDARPPFFTLRGGMLHRQCTHDFKIRPIEKKVRELIGLVPRQHWPLEPVVEQWIGISTDEAQRMKPSQRVAVVHRWPLIEANMSREDCKKWCASHGHPTPPKSACIFCPYTNDARWLDMKQNQPEEFQEAVEIDEIIRPAMPDPKRPKGDAWFLHAQRKPLRLVEFTHERQLDLFGNECEGMCGV